MGLFCLVLLGGFSWSHGIDVSEPKADACWKTGKEVVIQWTVEKVKEVIIELRVPGKKEKIVIAEKTPNTGEFKWTVPADVKPGTYKILIISTVDREIHGVSKEFKISDK